MEGIFTELLRSKFFSFFFFLSQHDERAFALKFSAMEIYNEVVRDLLSSDNNQLRLLDDPEVSFEFTSFLQLLLPCSFIYFS